MGWSTNLSVTLKILTTNYTQYSGPDCDSVYCYRDITTEITSDEYIINKIPELPVGNYNSACEEVM